MRLGIVRGHMTLTPAIESYRGKTLVVIEPLMMENLRAKNGKGGGKALIAIDELGAGEGQIVAFTEGREAANPFWPAAVPVDAYLSLIIDVIDVDSQKNSQRKSGN